MIPRVVRYCHLGIEYAENGSRDSHVRKVINWFVSNKNISTVAMRLLLVSVLHPILEYGSEAWACNKGHTILQGSLSWLVEFMLSSIPT